MRAVVSYLTGLLTLIMFLAVGGAWSSGPATVPLDIRPGVEPFGFVADVRAALIGAEQAEPTQEPSELCFGPVRDRDCHRWVRHTGPIEPDPRLRVPRRPRSAEDWRSLVEMFFQAKDVDRAVTVIGCESKGDPLAKNPVSTASGLFQHLGSQWPNRAQRAGWPEADIFDPVANVAVAAWLVYEGGGWSHWAASGHCW